MGGGAIPLNEHAWFYLNEKSIDVYIQPPDDRFESGYGNAVSVRIPLKKLPIQQTVRQQKKEKG